MELRNSILPLACNGAYENNAYNDYDVKKKGDRDLLRTYIQNHIT